MFWSFFSRLQLCSVQTRPPPLGWRHGSGKDRAGHHYSSLLQEWMAFISGGSIFCTIHLGWGKNIQPVDYIKVALLWEDVVVRGVSVYRERVHDWCAVSQMGPCNSDYLLVVHFYFMVSVLCLACTQTAVAEEVHLASFLLTWWPAL